MIPTVAWSIAGAYFVRSLFSSDLFHRVWSGSILSLFYLISICLGEGPLLYRTFYALLAALDLAVCIVLSPAQIFLFRKSPQRSKRWIETVLRTEDHAELDIIAVHGLGSTPETAWSHGEKAPHWLRHFLPDESGLNARILLYYHNSQWESHSLSLSMDEIARDLLSAIRSSRDGLDETERMNRPLVFIGYSFGGIIVKKAMLLNAQTAETIVHPDSTGCIFIATPHRGSAFAYAGMITSLLGHWSGSSPLHLKNLREGSEPLLTLQTEFRRTFQSHGDRIINCRETGHEYWLGMPLPQVVTRGNAELDFWQDIYIDESHREIRRVHDRQHPTYQKLLFCVKDLAGKVRRQQPKHKVESASGLTEERQYELLNGITYAAGAEHNHHAQSHQECEEGTRVELLATMLRWAEDSTAKRGFWIQGMAGTGKSTIAITMARKLAKKGFVIGSFFFRRGAEDRSNLSRFVLTIAHQLSIFSAFRPLIADALHLNPGIQEKTLQDQWHALVRRPISANGVAKETPIMLVIDAIDECERNKFGHHELVDFLSREENFEDLNLRIIATSRPQFGPHNEQTIGSSEQLVEHQQFALHKIEVFTVESDIRTFFRANFRRLQAKKEMPQSFPQEHHIEALTKRSSPLFIAAMTSLLFIKRNRLNPKSHFDLLLGQGQNTRGAPAGALDSMYLVVIKEAFVEQFGGGDNLEETSEALREILVAFQTYMGSLVVLQETLSYHDLAILLSADPEQVQTFFNMFTAVVDVSDTTRSIKILHQSFSDFLFNEQRLRIACDNSDGGRRLDHREIWVDAKIRHANLFECCLGIMEGRGPSGHSVGLKKDIFDFRCPSSGPADINSVINLQQRNKCMPPYLAYACRYWARHFLQSGHLAHQDMLRGFLQRHVLHWLEAMSWLGRVIEAINLLDELHSEVSNPSYSVSTTIAELISNTRLFARRHKGVMEECPLQIYSSSLLFSPEQFRSSLFQDISRGLRPDLIRTAAMIEEDWTTWSLAFEGHAKLLGSDGHGTKINTLQFSNSGNFVVSSNNSGNILVWDAQNGAILAQLRTRILPTFSAHPDWALSKTDLVAYRGQDKEGLGIWDVRQNKAMKRLPGSEEATLPVAFAPDSLTIASVFLGTKVRVWGMQENDQVQTLPERSEEKPIALSFNPHGGYLIVGYSDGVLCVHDKNNMWARHSILQIPDLHETRSLKLTWANDLLISTLYFDDGHKVCAALWNIEHAKLLKVITGRGDLWSCSSYLPPLDSIVTVPLACAGSASQVKIWPVRETATAEPSGEVFDALEEVDIFALSSDGNLLMGRTGFSDVRLWDIHTGELWSMLRFHHRFPSLGDVVSFSPSARACAVGGDDRIIRLWNSKAQTRQTQNTSDPMNVYDVNTKRHLAACATGGGEVHVCEIGTLRSVVQLPLPPGTRIDEVRFSSSEDFLIVAYGSPEGKTTEVHELVWSEGEPLAAKKVFSKEWHPGEDAVLECSTSGRLWGQVTQGKRPQMVEVFDIHTAETLAVYEFPHPVRDLKVVALLDSTPNTPALCVVAVSLERENLASRTPAEASQDPPSTKALFVLEYYKGEMSITQREVLPLPQYCLIKYTYVAFLPAENMMASTFVGIKGLPDLQMWDLMNFKPLGRPRVVPNIRIRLEICDRGLCLRSHRGIYSFRHDSRESFRKCGCGHIPVNWDPESPQWLMWVNQPFFWLPPDQRAIEYLFVVKNTVVLQIRSGKRPLSITFDRAKVEAALGF